VFRVDWEPKESCECKTQREAYYAGIQAHECHHVADNQAVVDEFNATDYSMRSYFSPKKNQKQAHAAIQKKIRADLDEDIHRIEAAAETKANAFHDTDQGQDQVWDCAACKAHARVGDDCCEPVLVGTCTSDADCCGFRCCKPDTSSEGACCHADNPLCFHRETISLCMNKETCPSGCD
jgi:hypothetical protein